MSTPSVLHRNLLALSANHPELGQSITRTDSDPTVRIIGSRNGRLLVLSETGELLLIAANATTFQLLQRISLGEFETQLLSHPALVGRHLYLRLGTTVARLSL